MYLICTKNPPPGCDGRVRMKTPVGLVFVAFAHERDAESFVSGSKAETHLCVESMEALLQRNPTAFDGEGRLLFLPSTEVVRSLRHDPKGFRYDRYVVPADSLICRDEGP